MRIHRFARRAPGGEELTSSELTLNSQHAVHLAASALPPGLVGIRWAWR